VGTQVRVAGTLIRDPIRRVRDYLSARGTRRTFEELHLRNDRSSNRLSHEDVVLTRRMRSRVSEDEAEWFVERGATARWRRLPAAAELRDAEPDTEAGRILLARGFDLYRHFFEERPSGVASAKIHKVLHVNRPAFVPIVDARLRSRYAGAARQMAVAHPELVGGWLSLAHWLAIREDLELSYDGLEQVRERVMESPEWLALGRAASDIDRVTDLTLLDIIAWVAP
jgi:hypothetical protein